MQDIIPANAASPESTGTHRLFFALWPDDATRAAIASAAARMRSRLPGGRWIPAARYHLTVHFLGTYRTLPHSLVDCACSAAASARAPGFSLALDRVGSFRARSQLWWLGCHNHDPLLPLRAALTRSLQTHDLPVAPAAFIPHVTLVRGARRPPPVEAGVVAIVWPVSSFALIHSEAGTRDAYRVVGQWPLSMP